jgi:NADH-quinone oxidoreductase subunit K
LSKDQLPEDGAVRGELGKDEHSAVNFDRCRRLILRQAQDDGIFFSSNFPMEITLNHYLAVGAILFVIGLIGVITRRNLIIIYMSLEMMLQAANLTLVAFSRFNGRLDGQVFVFFVITVAAAEVAVGLALIVALYRLRRTTQVEDLTSLKF